MATPITIRIDAQTAEAAAKMQQFFNGAVGGVDRLTGASHFLAGLGAKIAAAFTVGALVNFQRQAINTADDLNKLNQRTGVAVDLLDALRRQGEIADLSFGDLSNGLGLFNDRIFTAATRGGEAAQVFRDLRISLVDVEGRLRPTEQILLDVANAFQQMPDGQRKTAAAMDLFSRAGRQWIPLLNQGAEGMERLRNTEGGITPQMAEQAEVFNDSLTELKQTLDLIFIAVGQQLLPTLQQVVNRLKQATADTNSANTAAGGLVDVFKGLAIVGTLVVGTFVTLGRAVGSGLFIALDSAGKGIGLLIRTLRSLIVAIKTVALSFIDLAKTSAESFGVIQKVVSGDIKGAFDQLGGILERTQNNWAKILSAFPKHIANSWGDAADTVKNVVQSMQAVVESNFVDMFLMAESIQKLWASIGKMAPAGARPDKTTSAGGPVVNEELKRLADVRRQIALAEIQASVKSLRSDPLLTEAEKARQLIPLMERQMQLVRENIDLNERRLSDPNSNPETQIEAQKELLRLREQDVDLQRELQSLGSRDSFGFQMQTTLKEIVDEGSNLAQMTADAFKNIWDGAISSISNGISALIMGTKSWGQALQEIGSSILTNIVQSIVQVGVRWIATRILMATVGKTIEASMLAATQPLAAAYSLMWATPATLATIASFGGAAAAAPGLIALAEGVTMAQSVGLATFADGGRPKPGVPSIVGERGAELFIPDSSGIIIPAHQTASIMAGGGGGSPLAAGSASRPINFAFFDDRQQMMRWMESKAGEEIVVKHIRNNRLDLGMET